MLSPHANALKLYLGTYTDIYAALLFLSSMLSTKKATQYLIAIWFNKKVINAGLYGGPAVATERGTNHGAVVGLGEPSAVPQMVQGNQL